MITFWSLSIMTLCNFTKWRNDVKKSIIGILLIALVGLTWYLFMKPGEFEVSFKANTVPGDVIQVVKIWSRSLDDAVVTEVDSTEYLRQKISVDGREYLYEWRFSLLNDSTTKVHIAITQKGRELKNKLLVPVTEQPIETDASKLAYEFYDVLKSHLQITKVRVEGLSQIEESFCVCTEVKSDQLDKAVGMMKTYNFLVSFIEANNLQVKGKPVVEVQEWNHEQSHLKYNFCFPIAKSDSLPANTDFRYKTIERQRALKAVYNGNYITSDRAWYYLLQYAHKKGHKVVGLPIEVFYNNPNLGMDEQNWRAEIFLPVS